jgi:hypothetical protein
MAGDYHLLYPALHQVNGQFEGYGGPDQIIPLTFLIEAPGRSGLYFPDVMIRLRDGKIVPEQ